MKACNRKVVADNVRRTKALRKHVAADMKPLFNHLIKLGLDSAKRGYCQRSGQEFAHARRLAKKRWGGELDGARTLKGANLPKRDKRSGSWRGGDTRTLYTFIDSRTGDKVVKPGGGPFYVTSEPSVTVRVATKAEAEQHWQRPLHAGWKTIGRAGARRRRSR